MVIKQVNWGMIGCGDVTEKKSGPAFNKIDHSKLVAVMRRNGELAADYAKRHGIKRWYTDATNLINDPEVNAIYVATPPSTHAKYAIEAMKAGKPVYVEKPMATTYTECQEMLRISEETSVALFVAYYRRTLPGFLKVKKLLEDGQIGQPLLASIRLLRPALPQEMNGQDMNWRVNPSIAGGGIFYDLASHQLDFLDFLFGSITGVEGKAANRAGLYEAEDTVVASFKFSNGVIGSGIWSFVTDASAQEDTMEIIGTKGKIRFTGFDHSPVILYKDSGILEFPYLNPENIQFEMIREVVEAIRIGEECVSTGESGARTNWVMEQIVK